MKEKMRFEEFKALVKDSIVEWLPEQFREAKVELQTVTKNNNLKLTGLVIRFPSNNISPTIYLESFYEKYQEGESMEHILEKIVRIRLENTMEEGFDIFDITDLKRCKDKILPKLVGTAWNQEFLKERPHVLLADLAVTFYIDLGEKEEGAMSVSVHHGLAKMWEMETKELYDLAIENLTRNRESVFKTMREIMIETMISDRGERYDPEEVQEMIDMIPEDHIMNVLTNQRKWNGASALLDPEIMKKVVEGMGEEIYLLPSSIHEWIILPKTEDMCVEELRQMVITVNQSQVEPEEVLGENVYVYSLKDGLRIA